MYVGTRKTWLGTVVLGGRALPRIWLRTLLVTLLSIGVTGVYLSTPALHYSITTSPFVMTGIPLSIFLGFRNSAAYDRFWEGRKAWGSLVNTCRSLVRQTLTMVKAKAEAGEADHEALAQFRRDAVHEIIAYVHALRHHLRETDSRATLERVLGAEVAETFRDEPNVPVAILQRLGERYSSAHDRGWIRDVHWLTLEASLTSLTDVQGICERIKSTPIPYSYTVLLHRIVAVYCVLLPFGLDDTIGWGTPPVAFVISYALFGLDAIGAELEQPFGTAPNNLALDCLSLVIEGNLRVRIDEEAPPPQEARAGVLT